MTVLFNFRKLFSWLRNDTIPYSHLYSSEEEIISELARRQNLDLHELRDKLNLTPELDVLAREPRLVMFRQIATPLHETLHVINIAKRLNLELLILEYYDDLFVSQENLYKKGLGKLPIHTRTSKNGHDSFEYVTIIDFNNQVNQPLSEIYTTKGERLIDFHHELFEFVTHIPYHDVCVDGTEWFHSFPHGARDYYVPFLTLFTYQHVLAEIFLCEGGEKKLTEFVVNPAFIEVVSKQKRKPLILNYQPPEEQTRMYWDCYPKKVSEFIAQKGYSK